jgi:hypothetical protein
VAIGSRYARPAPVENAVFQYRSTMQEVLAAQGMPQRVAWDGKSDLQTWFYATADLGEARVEFKSGLVADWEDSGKTLHVIGTPPPIVQRTSSAQADRATASH